MRIFDCSEERSQDLVSSDNIVFVIEDVKIPFQSFAKVANENGSCVFTSIIDKNIFSSSQRPKLGRRRRSHSTICFGGSPRCVIDLAVQDNLSSSIGTIQIKLIIFTLREKSLMGLFLSRQMINYNIMLLKVSYLINKI